MNMISSNPISSLQIFVMVSQTSPYQVHASFCFNSSLNPFRTAHKDVSVSHPLELGKPTGGLIRTMLQLSTFLYYFVLNYLAMYLFPFLAIYSFLYSRKLFTVHLIKSMCLPISYWFFDLHDLSKYLEQIEEDLLGR